MAYELVLSTVEESTLDAVINLSDADKLIFFHKKIEYFYPNVEVGTQEYKNLHSSYVNSWMLEKIYRNNQYLKESFSVIYTKTALIRNVTNDLFFTGQDLVTH